MPEPLDPTDIWTADGRKVQVHRRSGLPFGVPGLPFGVPALPVGVPRAEVLAAAALAPMAVGVLAAGAAITAGAVAAGVASAAARSLLTGGPPPFVVGIRFDEDGVEVLVVRPDGRAARF